MSFKYESMQDAETIVAYLDAVKEGLASGKLSLSDGENTLVLEPTGLIKCDVVAKVKDGRRKLTLKFEWKEDGDEQRDRRFTIEPC